MWDTDGFPLVKGVVLWSSCLPEESALGALPACSTDLPCKSSHLTGDLSSQVYPIARALILTTP